MSENQDRAIRINNTLSTAGWKDIEEIAKGKILDAQATLVGMMDSKPDSLTGKTAIRLAARQRALKDFLEEIYDEVRINLPQSSKG